MTRTTFGKTGLLVSPLGFGAAEIGFLDTDQQRASSVLNLLLDRGVNVIDTAASYAGSEELVGNAIGHRRREFVLISKCGSKFEGMTGEAWSAGVIAQTIDRSLKRLKTDHLDVMLLHSCDMETLKNGEALGALADARDAGKIRFAGYSGDNDAAAYAATLPDIAVVETSISIADQQNIDRVLPVAFRANVGVLVKRPIANAAWRAPGEQSGLYVSYTQVYYDRLKAMKLWPGELGFAGDAAVAWPEVAMRFTLSQPGVNAAIIGTTNPEHVERNIAIAKRGALPTEVIRKIRDAFRRAETESGARWDGQT